MRYRAYVRYGNSSGHSLHRSLKGFMLLALIAIATPLAVFSGSDDASSARAMTPAPQPAQQLAPAPAPLVGPVVPSATITPEIPAGSAGGGEVATLESEPSRATASPAARAAIEEPSARRSSHEHAARRAELTAATPKRHVPPEDRAVAPTQWKVKVDDNARPGDARPDASWRSKNPLPGLEGVAVRRGIG
jgi:hypothetical protein